MNKKEKIKEGNAKTKTKKIPVSIPSDIPKIYATGALGGYSPHDFRILLYCEEPLQQDEIVPPENLEIMREVKAEIILSPLAAKETAQWLMEHVKEFEKEFGTIPGPETKK